MYVSPLVMLSVIISGGFFVWNYMSRVSWYNFFLISAQNATFPTELAGACDSIVKSLGIHAFGFCILYILSSLTIIEIELPVLGTVESLLSILVIAWPIFFSRREVYEAVIKGFKTPDWRDDGSTIVDIFLRSAGVCQILVWVLSWVSSLILG